MHAVTFLASLYCWLAAYAEYVFCLTILCMVGGYILLTCWLSLLVMLLFVG
jgi:hypothetical protein